jgi:DNA gyrase subunit A
MGTLRGVVKKVATSDFINAKTRGINAINLDEGDRLVSACLTHGKDEVVLITRKGQALRMTEEDVRPTGRSSRGVCGIKLENADELTAMLRVSDDQKMLVLSEYGYGKRVEFNNFNPHSRATHGQMIYCPEDRTGELVGAIAVLDSDNVMVITSQGKTLKFAAETVSTQGKGAKGVRILNIDRPDFVIGLDKVAREEDAEAQVDEVANATEPNAEVDGAETPLGNSEGDEPETPRIAADETDETQE